MTKKHTKKPFKKRHERAQKRRTFYLPDDLSAFIKQQADSQERSVSNYLATLIRRERDILKTTVVK